LRNLVFHLAAPSWPSRLWEAKDGLNPKRSAPHDLWPCPCSSPVGHAAPERDIDMEYQRSRWTGASHGQSPVARVAAGFTLVEIMVVLGLIAVLSAVTVMVMPTAVRSATADSGAARVASVLRTAREQAISQRRNIRVTFTAPNQIVVTRINVPATTTTTLGTTVLESGTAFQLFAGVPDTPDAFGNTTPTAFGGSTTVMFSSEGTFVDQNGDPVNGTVFLGKGVDPQSARAVTIFGPTALIRQWRWDGGHWTN
jgi:prepilin-type N-terminal cleavage/methylation domain-containing protein